MTRWIRPIVAMAAVALAVWQVKLLVEVLRGKQKQTAAETVLVRKGPFSVGITRVGTLGSANVGSISAPRSGSTLIWLIDDGARVEKGDLIAKVDVSQFQSRVDEQRMQYQNLAAQVEQERRNCTRDVERAEMQVDQRERAMDVLEQSQTVEVELSEAQVGHDLWNLKWAEANLDRYSRLSDVGIVPKSNVEQAERTLRSREYALTKSEKSVSHVATEHACKQGQAKADIDAAKFDIEAAKRRMREGVRHARGRAEWEKERLHEMEKQLASGELEAPCGGVVVLGRTWDRSVGGRRALREGDHVWWRRRIAHITDLTNLEVSVRVEESSADKIRLDQEVIVNFLGVPEREFEGKVSAIGAVARPAWLLDDPSLPPDQNVFDIKVTLLDPDLKVLRPGMKGDVQFIFSKVSEAIYIPVEAVFSKAKGKVVYVSVDGGFVPRRVETGERNDEAVVITKGLKEGERVALSDPTKTEAK
ncbi:MAG: HlyD family efflux transporter periplasmic adaptor subunit [Armatimonadetes bacterium]|nr:HlyD family efflux transporter periplasmic adaptor subunit [Armatimonadota bacterium]NIM24584.1 HlyD family efflux transporter periplasmic adaptor subunit [Armatimonadota bacterium]NIM68460.1 HlyD family efflux transporter periplasmic adaptor subunit [Armatimonadota bacterium]NIM76846.1 HlyD family efflux transporter periplasmic adaptor subunit [Armatimonadota bacterium]NIN06657.1 HlyD family efflux transporter periplasmic adaptor subunit [Armatimonadota bacterium]